MGSGEGILVLLFLALVYPPIFGIILGGITIASIVFYSGQAFGIFYVFSGWFSFIVFLIWIANNLDFLFPDNDKPRRKKEWIRFISWTSVCFVIILSLFVMAHNNQHHQEGWPETSYTSGFFALNYFLAFKLLGITGIIGFCYWFYQSMKNPISKKDSDSKKLDFINNEIAARAEKSSKTKRKKLTTKNVLYHLFGAYGICLGIYTIVKFFY